MQAFQLRLQALQQDWREQLPVRLAEIRRGIDACRDDPQDAERLRDLQRAVHTLAGSAGTFGMAPLGESARIVAEDLKVLMGRTQRTPADFDGARAWLDRWAAQGACDR